MTSLYVFRLSAQLSDRADRRSERGANLVEYTMLIGLIALVCIAAVTVLGEAAEGPYSEISSGIRQ